MPTSLFLARSSVFGTGNGNRGDHFHPDGRVIAVRERLRQRLARKQTDHGHGHGSSPPRASTSSGNNDKAYSSNEQEQRGHHDQRSVDELLSWINDTDGNCASGATSRKTKKKKPRARKDMKVPVVSNDVNGSNASSNNGSNLNRTTMQPSSKNSKENFTNGHHANHNNHNNSNTHNSTAVTTSKDKKHISANVKPKVMSAITDKEKQLQPLAPPGQGQQPPRPTSAGGGVTTAATTAPPLKSANQAQQQSQKQRKKKPLSTEVEEVFKPRELAAEELAALDPASAELERFKKFCADSETEGLVRKEKIKIKLDLKSLSIFKK